ncbi:MAG: DUF4252 domain-containing protein [Polaribacter sp.]|uniref:DUF4252 domain-containing protein n=1 Tax=Polaribacter sp. TaxID=1920175 RepID=UPI002611B600|nr:DUF4252 domain-containing protein [Polaribacter sp.]MBT3741454.1 DUF4252 domain-containing protein [Polaribacter sp.]MDG1195705.1 DUF4252 domain-containing protein [Polaribacter sp.]MDG1403756.1 DUF4252 domain-containing protein [Polaribacter sp.]MDG2437119.1 DUF4252 domain-containing protein [Polaribacter sp.]
MKRLTVIISAFFIITVSAQEEAFKKFYKVNKDKSAFSINLSTSLAGSFLDDEDEESLSTLIKKSSNFKLMVFDNEDDTVSKNFKKFTRKNRLKTLARVKDKEGKAEFFFIEINKFITEIIIRANSNNDKLVLFGLKTKITKDELASVFSSSDVKISSK